jgi:hypothetical protein
MHLPTGIEPEDPDGQGCELRVRPDHSRQGRRGAFEQVESHISDHHPDLLGTITREDLLSMAEEE